MSGTVGHGLESYRFGQKNNWRRRTWNDIAGRLRALGRQPRDAVVLYLPGPDDLDRVVAKEKGFRDANLIAIDANPAVALRMGRLGKLVIRHRLEAVLDQWNPDRNPVHVIHADLCTNINRNVVMILSNAAAICRRSGGGVVMLNMLRGREAGVDGIIATQNPGDRHRGKTAFLVWSLMSSRFDNDGTPTDNGLEWFDYTPEMQRWVDLAAEECDLGAHTYRSNKSTMDSIIGTFVMRTKLPPIRNRKSTAVARSIAATLAHRTRRS